MSGDEPALFFGLGGARVWRPEVRGAWRQRGKVGQVVVLTAADVKPKHTYPCIKCGHCLDACPVFLNPQALGQMARAARYDEMMEYDLMDCMLCGSCSYVCPSNIPLVQYFRIAKAINREQAA